MTSATPATDIPSAPARRSAWRAARLVDARPETATARTLVLEVGGWAGHLPGQHVDVRLTAEDGYTAERSYSLAAPPAADRIELTVQRVADGEVSPFLIDDFRVGDVVEVRGPLGRWFVRRPADRGPLLLVAGGAGIVPLMAMIRARDAVAQAPPCRLLYSIRTPADVLYAEELRARDRADVDLTITLIHTRTAPPDAVRPPGRISATDLGDADRTAAVYVCGPTGFVEHAANLLIALGFPAAMVRTERFGPSGGGT